MNVCRDSRTLSVISLSKPWVNARDAISRCTSMPQFLVRDSASVSVYSWTFDVRCVSRLRMAATTFRALEQLHQHQWQASQRAAHIPVFALLLHFVAYIHNELPVFIRHVLVRRLCCRSSTAQSAGLSALRRTRRQEDCSPTISS